MKNQMDRKTKLEELISKFKNGQERYNTSPLVRNCINSILNGSDPIPLIDQLITINEDIVKRFEDYVKHSPSQLFIPKTKTE